MNAKLLISTIILSVLFTISNCSKKTSKNKGKEKPAKQDFSQQKESSTSVFQIPEVPVMITDEQESSIYLAKHYWDLFPFSDSALISQPGITEQGLVDYIQILNHIPYSDAESSLHTMMNKAKVNDTMYNHFASLFEKYLYDLNSPFRNDEFYIPIVGNLLQSGMLSETKQAVYSFQQEKILKNRVGTKATDFVYTLANGDTKNMHALKTDYLILFFTNPDCPACGDLTKQIDNSDVLRSVFSLNNNSKNFLQILTVYLDSDIEEWRRALPSLPQNNWINAYDDGTIITNKSLYDIKAIPTLYLLDKNKQVILIDSSFEGIEGLLKKVR